MSLDPRTPVLVAGGQVSQRVDRGDPVLEPVALIAEAASRAGAAAGSPSILGSIDSIRIVQMLSWRYRDPGALVAARIGASPRQSIYTTGGGNTPQSLLNTAARDIAAGRCDVVLIGGAEAWRTRMSLRLSESRPDWTTQDDGVPEAEPFGGDFLMTDPMEMARGLLMPVQMYPIFEQALRVAEGRGLEENLVRTSELWARFSEVAAANPHAWIREPLSADAIRTPGPDNRWIGYPYTKVMNSNNAVEQGAAVLLCSVEAAEHHGISRDEWVFPLAGTDAHDTYSVSHRAQLHRSPAIRVAAATALELAGLGVDEVNHVDLYSCFPSAVEIAAGEIGLEIDDPARPLTVTGGLSFAGGPWNNYVTHSIATMADVLRADPGATGLVNGNGGFITKHAIGVYSTTPPLGGFRWADVQAVVDREPERDAVATFDGKVQIEAWTVMHDREGSPVNAILSLLTPDGARTWGTSTDEDALATLCREDVAGQEAGLVADGTLTL